MGLRCKPGDLAFIVSPAVSEVCGRVVRVLEFEGLQPFYRGGNLLAWLARSEGSPLRIIDHAGAVDYRMTVIVADCCLRPIRPEPELLPAPPQEVSV